MWDVWLIRADLPRIWSGIGTAVDLTVKSEVAERLRDVQTEALRQLAPDTGAYMSESDPTEPNWQQTFWGDHYPRLLSLKQLWDPEGVFWCIPCVGHELWTVSDGDGIGQDGGVICRNSEV